MAQNEERAMRGLPQGVRLSEGLARIREDAQEACRPQARRGLRCRAWWLAIGAPSHRVPTLLWGPSHPWLQGDGMHDGLAGFVNSGP